MVRFYVVRWLWSGQLIWARLEQPHRSNPNRKMGSGHNGWILKIFRLKWALFMPVNNFSSISVKRRLFGLKLTGEQCLLIQNLKWCSTIVKLLNKTSAQCVCTSAQLERLPLWLRIWYHGFYPLNSTVTFGNFGIYSGILPFPRNLIGELIRYLVVCWHNIPRFKNIKILIACEVDEKFAF